MKEFILGVDVISGKKIMDDWMHAADVFEAGKKAGTYTGFKITIEAEKVPEDMHIRLKKAIESGGSNVMFIGIDEINGVKPEIPMIYWMENVQTISNGHTYGRFMDILTTLGYKVKTDERVHVTSVEY